MSGMNFSITEESPLILLKECELNSYLKGYHAYMPCVKSVHIRSYSGPHFPEFGLNRKRYSVSLRIQSECGKMRTRITPSTHTFYAVMIKWNATLG